MPKGMQPIFTQTVTGTAPTSINFNNIPQTYTDLILVTSDRSGLADVSNDWILYFNNVNDGLVGSTLAQTNASGSAVAGRLANYNGAWAQYSPAANATANTFGYASFHIPNYTSNTFKQVIADSVSENNSATNFRLCFNAHSWRSNAAVTSLAISHGGQTIALGSTLTLYGLAR
jgi:hypothetical protein